MTTQQSISIGKANETLRKALDLVDQAYSLIISDPAAKDCLELQCKIGWKDKAWDLLNEAYVAENPASENTYHLRAFSHFGLQAGVCISTGGMSDGSSS